MPGSNPARRFNRHYTDSRHYSTGSIVDPPTTVHNVVGRQGTKTVVLLGLSYRWRVMNMLLCRSMAHGRLCMCVCFFCRFRYFGRGAAFCILCKSVGRQGGQTVWRFLNDPHYSRNLTWATGGVVLNRVLSCSNNEESALFFDGVSCDNVFFYGLWERFLFIFCFTPGAGFCVFLQHCRAACAGLTCMEIADDPHDSRNFAWSTRSECFFFFESYG